MSAASTALVKFLAVARLGAVADRNALIAFNPTTDDKASKNYKAYCRDLMGKASAMQPGKQNVLTATDFDFVIMPDPLEGKEMMLFFAVLDKKFGLHFDSANLFDDFKSGFYTHMSTADIRAADAEGAVHTRSQELLTRLARTYGSPDGRNGNNGALAAPAPPVTPTPPPSDASSTGAGSLPPPRQEFGKRPRATAGSGGWGSGSNSEPPPPSLPPPSQAPAVSPTAQEGPKFGRRQGGATGAFGAANETKTAAKKPMDKYEAAEMATTAIQEMKDIPALEEQETDDYTDRIQHAPNVRSKQVQTLSDLDGPGGFSLPSSTSDGFDLTALTAAFAPKEKIGEADVMWDFDSLFSQLSSEMQSEEGEEEEGEFTIAPKMGGPIGGSGAAAANGGGDKKEEKTEKKT